MENDARKKGYRSEAGVEGCQGTKTSTANAEGEGCEALQGYG
jgi:hypothetical protein